MSNPRAPPAPQKGTPPHHGNTAHSGNEGTRPPSSSTTIPSATPPATTPPTQTRPPSSSTNTSNSSGRSPSTTARSPSPAYFRTHGRALADRVLLSDDDQVTKAVRFSGHRVLRMLLMPGPDPARLPQAITRVKDAVKEAGLLSKWSGDRHVAVDVPPGRTPTSCSRSWNARSQRPAHSGSGPTPSPCPPKADPRPSTTACLPHRNRPLWLGRVAFGPPSPYLGPFRRRGRADRRSGRAPRQNGHRPRRSRSGDTLRPPGRPASALPSRSSPSSRGGVGVR
jgi:hypothetical protein